MTYMSVCRKCQDLKCLVRRYEGNFNLSFFVILISGFLISDKERTCRKFILCDINV
jgi:hypothetical protein